MPKRNGNMMNGRGGEDVTPPLHPGPLTPPPNEDSAPPWHDDNTRSSASGSKDSSDEEPPSKVRKVSQNATEELDGETCPICLESWSTSGPHRLAALKCGHLFGAECVRRWLRARPAGQAQRACPTCKTKANVKDLRYIYARRLVAVDDSQITELKQEIDTLQADKTRVELELQKSKIAHRACAVQLEGLRSLMKSQTQGQPHRKTWRFALEKNLEVCKDGGCRVLTYNCRTYELYVSQKSTNSLFPGYGIRKVSLNGLSEYSLGQYFHLHPKAIRDITYSQPRDLLLSVALDSTAKIVERCSAVSSIDAGFPLWSCSWDYLRSHELYVGGVGGLTHRYDMRNPSRPLQALAVPSDVSPVISVCSTEFGLLSCQLNSAWLWPGPGAGGGARALPVEGAFTSLRYDGESQRAALLARPAANGLDRSRLSLVRLRAGAGPDGEAAVEVEDTFPGSARSALMCRAAWVKVPDTAWLAAHSESDAALHLHGLHGGRSLSLSAAAPTLDVAAIDLNGTTLLAALSDSRLKLYKAVAAQL